VKPLAGDISRIGASSCVLDNHTTVGVVVKEFSVTPLEMSLVSFSTAISHPSQRKGAHPKASAPFVVSFSA
jgi:hypothetical protein